jgi:hypothetical protein
MLQVFQLFQTYVTSVSSGYCKSRLGVAHIAMRVKSGGDASGLAAWAACETQARARLCWRGHGVQTRARDEV